ncbi:MAG: translation initiation factor IF-2 [Clostridiales bacterium]|nr:translation initiation factor IF-2 [Clostridiales bacterium]
MLSNSKYRISNLAKDINVKSKDIVDMLAAKGYTDLTHMAVLEQNEFNIVMDQLTSDNQIGNIDRYINGEIVIRKTEPPKPEEPKADVAKARQPKNDEVKADLTKTEAAKTEQPKADDSKVRQTGADTAASDTGRRTGGTRQNDNRGQSGRQGGRRQSSRGQSRQDTQQRAGSVQNNQGTGRQTAPQQGQQLQRSDKPDTAKRDQQAAAQHREGGQQRVLARFEQKQQPQTAKEQAERRKKQQAERKKQADSRKQQSSSILQRTDVAKGEVKVETIDSGSRGSRIAGARVVDTRSSNAVDLSKYDERLDKIAADASASAGKKVDAEKQKLKKQDNRRDREKERLALEKLRKQEALEKAKKAVLTITIPDEIIVSELAMKLKVTAAEVVKKLMMMGMMITANQTIDFDTAYLIADEFGAKVNREVVVTIEDRLFDEAEDTPESLEERPPIVVVMGHVDHGKTSLLDAIRNANVTAGEAGGITQAIGAYSVTVNGKPITFLDTPGHEAFTSMRARGAQCTDIAILVVAADDGIMPQTVEAINHAKAAGVSIIVAINKMDKYGADPETVKTELTKYDLVPEEWGGDIICVPVSALTKMGIDDLLENVQLVAEMKELKANPNRRAKGIIIEAKLDKGRGPVATVLVQNGTLNSGDVVIAGTAVGRIRTMTNDKGEIVKTAGPSHPVEIDGLSDVPIAGDEFNAVEDERMARELAEQRRAKQREDEFNASRKAVSFDNLVERKELNIIVKADVVGSEEAVKASLLKIPVEEVRINIVHSAVGGISESDVMLAAASDSIIVGFNVRPDKGAIDSAERQNVEIRTYRVIYECIEEIEAAAKGMLAPTFREKLLGHVAVRQTIRVPNVGTIAGSYVQDGIIRRNAQIRVLRDGVILAEDKISSLRRFKDDVREVAQGYECGVGLEHFNDLKVGDIFEVFEMEEVKHE